MSENLDFQWMDRKLFSDAVSNASAIYRRIITFGKDWGSYGPVVLQGVMSIFFWRACGKSRKPQSG